MKLYIFLLYFFIISSCSTAFYKIYGITPITSYSETSDMKFLTDLKLPNEKGFFEPCSHTTIVQRIIINLISSYQSLGKSDKVKELLELKDIITA